ncbi:hypothetical protein HNQ50_002447 [Silvimonas terrae]|uniref:Uncharacterized protein n=1 Tax=Silvimonas terrae TaxID=300266 RepID=A0A840RFB8_9NEIS|nr:hypothetical protein [Silvimonas terrae]MBB5191717.1 hypothetical protein [Silvimonas terrae]
MGSREAQDRILQIISQTLSPVLPKDQKLTGQAVESGGGHLYIVLAAQRHASAPDAMRYGLDLAFKMPAREWGRFQSTPEPQQAYLLQTFEQTIRGKLAEAFEHWKDVVDFRTASQSEPKRITFIEFDNFGQ